PRLRRSRRGNRDRATHLHRIRPQGRCRRRRGRRSHCALPCRAPSHHRAPGAGFDLPTAPGAERDDRHHRSRRYAERCHTPCPPRTPEVTDGTRTRGGEGRRAMRPSVTNDYSLAERTASTSISTFTPLTTRY